MKKSLIIWTNYLLYALLTLSLLSIVLYAANNFINHNKVRIILSENENLIIYLDKKIKDAYMCYKCQFKEFIEVPESSLLELNNSWINVTIIVNKKYFYNFTSKIVNVNITEKKGVVIYKLYKKSENFNGDIKITKGEHCLLFNKTIYGLNITLC